MNKAFKRYGKKRYMDTPFVVPAKRLEQFKRDAMQSCHFMVNSKDDYNFAA